MFDTVRAWSAAVGRVAIGCVLCLLAVRPAAGDANALVRALIKPDLATLSPDAVTKRFAKLVPLERAHPMPNMLLLAGGDMQQRLELRYEANDGGKQRFAHAMLRFLATDPEADHRALQQALRKKLGEPRYERRDDGPLPTVGWRLGRLEVALSHTEIRGKPWMEVSVQNPR